MTKIYCNETNQEYDRQTLIDQNGIYQLGDTKLYLTQYPYINQGGTPTQVFYQAHAIDDDGNSYMIFWDIINEDTEDESEACDWEDYTVQQS